MKRNGIFIGIIVLCCVLRPFFGLAQERHVSGEYTFTMEYEVERTPVKDQGNTGTCWCFATLSFLESEILRTGGEPLDLSEMFLVRHLYPHKAMNYFRQHGNTVFGQGSLSHDALFCLREYGIVPVITDPEADVPEAKHEYGIDINPMEDIKDMDAVIIAVRHNEFLKLSKDDLDKLYKNVPNRNKVLIDVKGVLNRDEYQKAGYRYWSL